MELYTLGRGIYSAHSCACSGLPVLSYLRPRPCHHSLLWVADPLPAKERERKVAPCLFWECCVRRRLHKACATPTMAAMSVSRLVFFPAVFRLMVTRLEG